MTDFSVQILEEVKIYCEKTVLQLIILNVEECFDRSSQNYDVDNLVPLHIFDSVPHKDSRTSNSSVMESLPHKLDVITIFVLWPQIGRG